MGKKLWTYPLKVSLPDAPAKVKSPSSKDPAKSKLDEMTEQLRDVQITWITKLENEDSKKLYDKLMASCDSHLPLHLARLQFLDNGGTPSSNGDGSTAGAKSDISVSSSPKSDSDTPNANYSTSGKRLKTLEICKEMIEIADKVLKLVDQPALLVIRVATIQYRLSNIIVSLKIE